MDVKAPDSDCDKQQLDFQISLIKKTAEIIHRTSISQRYLKQVITSDSFTSSVVRRFWKAVKTTSMTYERRARYPATSKRNGIRIIATDNCYWQTEKNLLKCLKLQPELESWLTPASGIEKGCNSSCNITRQSRHGLRSVNITAPAAVSTTKSSMKNFRILKKTFWGLQCLPNLIFENRRMTCAYKTRNLVRNF